MQTAKQNQEFGGQSYLYPFYYKAPFSKPYTTSVPVEHVHLRDDLREPRIEAWIDRIEDEGIDGTEPIHGVRVYGDIFLQDGNHRTEAYRRLGIPKIKARLESCYYDEVLKMSVFSQNEKGWEMRYAAGVSKYDWMPEGYKQLEGKLMVSWNFEPIDGWQHGHLLRLRSRRKIGTHKLRKQIQEWVEEKP